MLSNRYRVVHNDKFYYESNICTDSNGKVNRIGAIIEDGMVEVDLPVDDTYIDYHIGVMDKSGAYIFENDRLKVKLELGGLEYTGYATMSMDMNPCVLTDTGMYLLLSDCSDIIII